MIEILISRQIEIFHDQGFPILPAAGERPRAPPDLREGESTTDVPEGLRRGCASPGSLPLDGARLQDLPASVEGRVREGVGLKGLGRHAQPGSRLGVQHAGS